jgi:poly-D-alanine transfer protein DltD
MNTNERLVVVPLYLSFYTIKELNNIAYEEAKKYGIDPQTIQVNFNTTEYSDNSFSFKRPETDQEKEKRLRQQKKLEDSKKKMKEVAEKKERKEYERLKTKFEKRSSPHFMDGK